MRLSISAATVGAILSSCTVLSKYESFLLAEAATNSKVKQDAEYKYSLEEMFLRLKQKLRAKTELRKKLGSHGGYLVFSSGENCSPFQDSFQFEREEGDTTDVGILGCRNPEQLCIEDASFSLGGICADVINRGDVVTEIDPGLTKTKKIEQFKPVFLKDKLRANYLVQQNIVEGGGQARFFMQGECTPPPSVFELIHTSVDAGILGRCQNSDNICVKDPSSFLGGTCVDISAQVDDFIPLDTAFERGRHLFLTECYYRNGTSGMKCSHPQACHGLTSSFVYSNIGCGSCNGYGACVGMSGVSVVGEESCNGVNACRYQNWANSDFHTSITIASKSCNDYYACAYALGEMIVKSDSCNGVYACMGLNGKTIIGEQSCNQDGDCKYSSDNMIARDIDLCAPSPSPAHYASFVPSSLSILPSKSPTEEPLSCFLTVRRVKLHQSLTGKPIQVFELQVISSGGSNVAIGKTATQSSTLNASSKSRKSAKISLRNFNAANAVDGNLTTFSHTDDANAWLEIDLGKKHAINSVGIQNRWCGDPSDQDGCLCRLSNATLYLIDGMGTKVLSMPIGNTCGQLTLEFVFDPDPNFCREKSSLSVLAPSKQHSRSLKKKPKC